MCLFAFGLLVVFSVVCDGGDKKSVISVGRIGQGRTSTRCVKNYAVHTDVVLQEAKIV